MTTATVIGPHTRRILERQLQGLRDEVELTNQEIEGLECQAALRRASVKTYEAQILELASLLEGAGPDA